jgi:hypothetical protein
MFEECRTLLLDVSLYVDVSDRWCWLPDPTGGYSIRGAYHLLITKAIPMAVSMAEMIWHKHVL